MFFISVSRSINVTQCIVPQEGIDYLLSEDFNYQFIYGVRLGQIYTYDLGGRCQPIKSYHIPYNSTLHLASNLIFVDS